MTQRPASMATPVPFARPAPVIARVGIGLKPQHYDEILRERPDLGFFEVHAENYMGAGGPPHHYLRRIRDLYPLSLHGVALSIGGNRPLNKDHLARLKALIERYQPGLFSEHLAWSTHEEAYMGDLLPLPYTEETLKLVCAHIDEAQEAVGRAMLLENPSTYVQFAATSMSEIEFLGEVVARTGCGLLLDVNNVFVQATNHHFEPFSYIDAFPVQHVGEIHLAGHDQRLDDAGAPLLIDAHGSPVADPVWALYEYTIARTGPVPTLIERDADVPPLGQLLAEAGRAETILTREAQRRATAPAAAE
jgi:uncharacterized protein (UPF0276 family)